MKRIACAAVALLGLLATSPVLAMDLKYTDPVAPPAPSMVGLALRTVVALGVVIGLVYGVAWFLRKAQPSLSRMHSRRGALEVESQMALGPRRTLYAVKWGKFRLLLGSGGSEIRLLASEWVEQDGEAALDRAALPDEAQFGQRLDDFLSRLGRVEDDHAA